MSEGNAVVGEVVEQEVVVGEGPRATTLLFDPRRINVWDVRLQQWVNTRAPDPGLMETLSEQERIAIRQHLSEWFAQEERARAIEAGEIEATAEDSL